jgi:hypothetical protein
MAEDTNINPNPPSPGPAGSVPFECEACGLTGEVEDPRHMESVSCPECNARYLYWPEGQKLGARSPWKCVVRPYFADSPNSEVSSGAKTP